MVTSARVSTTSTAEAPPTLLALMRRPELPSSSAQALESLDASSTSCLLTSTSSGGRVPRRESCAKPRLFLAQSTCGVYLELLRFQVHRSYLQFAELGLAGLDGCHSLWAERMRPLHSASPKDSYTQTQWPAHIQPVRVSCDEKLPCQRFIFWATLARKLPRQLQRCTVAAPQPCECFRSTRPS